MQEQEFDAKKIAFIVQHVSDDYLQETIQYLSALHVPDGYEAEIIPVALRKNVAAINNRGMHASNAKYKVYLRPGTIILHENFIVDVVRIFQANEQIAMLGIHGTCRFATNALWKFSAQVGKLLFPDGKRFEGIQITNDIQEVMILSDALIVTQYDLPWRSDLFDSDTYYVEGQCIEFRRRHKACAVVQQNEDWAIVAPMKKEVDERSRNQFLDAYSKDIYPLVSVLCLTHNRPEYFKIALDSVVHQTYRNLDIFITDDSSDTRTKEMVERDYHDARIHYEYNPSFTAVQNHKRGAEYDNPKAEFINWLMDDDYFMPHKIERMVEIMLLNPYCTLCTSYRILVDEHGNRLPDSPLTKPITQTDNIIDGDRLGWYMLMTLNNCIGEPSTVLYRKSALQPGKQRWTTEAGIYGLADILAWAQLLTKGNCAYIVEPLSAFRIHKKQMQKKVDVVLAGVIQWAFFIKLTINQSKFLHTREDKTRVLYNWLMWSSQQIRIALSWDFNNWNCIHAKRLRKIQVSFVNALERGDFNIDFSIGTDYEVD